MAPCSSCLVRPTQCPDSQVLMGKINLLDTVVLERDLAEHGLQRGDLGAIVDVHPPDGMEVEFVVASGRTQALVTLREADVRAVGDAGFGM